MCGKAWQKAHLNSIFKNPWMIKAWFRKDNVYDHFISYMPSRIFHRWFVTAVRLRCAMVTKLKTGFPSLPTARGTSFVASSAFSVHRVSCKNKISVKLWPSWVFFVDCISFDALDSDRAERDFEEFNKRLRKSCSLIMPSSSLKISLKSFSRFTVWK